MERVDLVCLGDSIVYGYGVSSRYAWPYLASKTLGINILNKGENGDTADGMNVRFMKDVAWNHPKSICHGGSQRYSYGGFHRSIQEKVWI